MHYHIDSKILVDFFKTSLPIYKNFKDIFWASKIVNLMLHKQHDLKSLKILPWQDNIKMI